MSYPTIDLVGSSAAQDAPASGFHLTPLSTGQVLDRTFVLYRTRFALFAGLAVFPAAVSLLVGLAQLLYLLAAHQAINVAARRAQFSAASVSLSGIGGLARLCVYGISIAATTWCIANIYLGKPATMRAGFDFAFRRWFRYVVMVLAQAWFAMWLPMILVVAVTAGLFAIPGMRAAGSFGVGVLIFVEAAVFLIWMLIGFIRVSLAIPACVVEQLPIRASIRRSRALLVSRKFRIFLLFLLIVVLEWVFVAILIPVSAIAVRHGTTGLVIVQIVTLVVMFLYGVLVSPIAAIGLCLFYFDERVRREGFDIEFLMSKAMASADSPAQAGQATAGDVSGSSVPLEAGPPQP